MSLRSCSTTLLALSVCASLSAADFLNDLRFSLDYSLFNGMEVEADGSEDIDATWIGLNLAYARSLGELSPGAWF